MPRRRTRRTLLGLASRDQSCHAIRKALSPQGGQPCRALARTRRTLSGLSADVTCQVSSFSDRAVLSGPRRGSYQEQARLQAAANSPKHARAIGEEPRLQTHTARHREVRACFSPPYPLCLWCHSPAALETNLFHKGVYLAATRKRCAHAPADGVATSNPNLRHVGDFQRFSGPLPTQCL